MLLNIIWTIWFTYPYKRILRVFSQYVQIDIFLIQTTSYRAIFAAIPAGTMSRTKSVDAFIFCTGTEGRILTFINICKQKNIIK